MEDRKKCAGVVIIKDDYVLLVKHTESAKLPTGAYGFPAGGLEDGEDFRQAAARELKQEAGLETTVDDLEDLGLYPNVIIMKKGSRHFEFHPYLCLRYTGTPHQCEEQTVPEWMLICDLNKIQLVSENVIEITQKARQEYAKIYFWSLK